MRSAVTSAFARARAARRARGHHCPECLRPWALQARRERSRHPAGAEIIAWVVSCRFCEYRRSRVMSVDVGGKELVFADAHDVADAM